MASTIEEDTPYSTTKLGPAATRRGTPSLSSSSPRSSSSSFSFIQLNDESPPHSPTTPLKPKGIPFSWEQVPGIPKHRYFRNKNPTLTTHLLPLPPAGNHPTRKLQSPDEISPKKHHMTCRDPFLAALMACSKDEDKHHHDDHGDIWKQGTSSSKVSRTLSDRFGLINIMYSSCKRTCVVSESVVYLPRSAPHYLNLHRRR